MECPCCNGRKTFDAFIDYADPDGSRQGEFRRMTCQTCGGTGTVTEDVAHAIARGRKYREARMARGESLRECAQRLGISAADLSRVERGEIQLMEAE